jgi:tRNA uridine 5-carboxymethylaminomethyl modification enzyme
LSMFPEYDVIVVGAGHAGCEAAAAAANMGSKVLLVTMNMQTIGQMSCNPAMGGIAKGQIVREIDAMGGYSGLISDKSMIQYRMLNRSKGPAMWSPRTQNDRAVFAEEWRLALEQTLNVDFWQEMVSGLIVENGQAKGIRTQMGIEIRGKAVVLTNGTFLNGIIHIGEKQFGGGRVGEKAATGITEQLLKLGFEAGRMKTGTPPRVDSRSLDFTKMEEQFGDALPGKFSYDPSTAPLQKQMSCWITYTNQQVHDTLRTGFEKSPMFSGSIQGLGPRYCPSIEDKIDRFADKDRHQLFVEPEGWKTVEVYVNGFSTSLPEDVQYKALSLVPGFEKVKMFRPGYAIEYDYFPPTQLKLSLETKLVKNLFFAGQINGTTGYEEAAAQGLMAGINAHKAVLDESPLILKRSEAYIGVLIDDLITKGTEEPYRMFTSRAEYRILLRQDNADLRLTPLSHEIGLAGESRFNRVREKQSAINEISKFFKTAKADKDDLNAMLNNVDSPEVNQSQNLFPVLARPHVGIQDFMQFVPSAAAFLSNFDTETLEAAEIEMKYEGYITRERETAEKITRLENINISVDFDFGTINSLSYEAREKLNKIKPGSIGQASRISGVTPADISVLLVHLGR